MEELFDIIYLDPPWRFDNASKIKPPYSTMSFDELKEIEIPAKENCLMYLWTTNAHLPQALKLMEHWGFTYITNIVWDKIRAVSMVMWHISHHELLLIGKKGNFSFPPHDKVSRSVVRIRKSDFHSEKPQYFRNLIDDCYPDKSKIEMFARNYSKGWVVLGHEVGNRLFTLDEFIKPIKMT